MSYISRFGSSLRGIESPASSCFRGTPPSDKGISDISQTNALFSCIFERLPRRPVAGNRARKGDVHVFDIGGDLQAPPALARQKQSDLQSLGSPLRSAWQPQRCTSSSWVALGWVQACQPQLDIFYSSPHPSRTMKHPLAASWAMICQTSASASRWPYDDHRRLADSLLSKQPPAVLESIAPLCFIRWSLHMICVHGSPVGQYPFIEAAAAAR